MVDPIIKLVGTITINAIRLAMGLITIVTDLKRNKYDYINAYTKF